MSNDFSSDALLGAAGLTGIAGCIWYTVINSYSPIYFPAYMASEGNVIVFSAILGAMSVYGFLSACDTEAEIVSCFSCLVTIPFIAVGYSMGWEGLLDNLLVTLFHYAMALLTFGFATYTAYLLLKMPFTNNYKQVAHRQNTQRYSGEYVHLQRVQNRPNDNEFDFDENRFSSEQKQEEFIKEFDDKIEQEQAEAEKQEQEQERKAQEEFSAAFDERQKPKPPPKTPELKLPAGVEYRHPDDTKYWNVVDDPASSLEERLRALRFAIIADNKRGRKPQKHIFSSMPYGIEKRHKDDIDLWERVDNYQLDLDTRRGVLKNIIRKENRRNGVVNPNVEYFKVRK